MEDTLVEVHSSCARIITDKKEIHRRLSRITSESTEWESKEKLAKFHTFNYCPGRLSASH